jgi:hypothetical protein
MNDYTQYGDVISEHALEKYFLYELFLFRRMLNIYKNLQNISVKIAEN